MRCPSPVQKPLYNSYSDFQKALSCFQTALPLYQQLGDRRGEANVTLNLGISHDYLGHPQQADGYYHQALEIAQSLSDLELELSFRQLIISVTQISRGGRYQEALAAENAIAAHYQRGTTLLEQGRYQEALDAYDSVIQLAPEASEAYQGKAVVLHRLGEMTEALQSCEKALQFRPDFAEAQHIKAGILLTQGKLKEAMTSCEEAIRLCPTAATAHHLKAGILKEQGRFQEAIKACEQALQLNPDGSPGFAMIRQSYILLCLGFSRRSTNILYFPVHFPP